MNENKDFEYYIRQRDNYIQKLGKEKIEYYEKKKQIGFLKKNITDDFIINNNADNRFYYFRFIFKDKIYYKIGITSQTLKNRYASDYLKIDKFYMIKKLMVQ